MSRDGLLYLEDVAQAAEKIGRYLDDLSFEEFCSNELVFDAVLFNLQILGEAAKNLPDTVKAAMPEISWSARPLSGCHCASLFCPRYADCVGCGGQPNSGSP